MNIFLDVKFYFTLFVQREATKIRFSNLEDYCIIQLCTKVNFDIAIREGRGILAWLLIGKGSTYVI